MVCEFAGLLLRRACVEDSTVQVEAEIVFCVTGKDANYTHEVLTQFWCVFYSNFYLFHSGFLMFLRHMAVPTGGPTAVHLGQIWRASQLQQITWITSRRLSQYPTPAKKTSMTCVINNGLWSARGLMISNSLTACGDWGVQAREIWWNNYSIYAGMKHIRSLSKQDVLVMDGKATSQATSSEQPAT